MSEFSWDTQVVDEAPPRPAAEEAPKQDAEPETVALSVDEFSALEQKILRAVDLVKRERQGRVAAEERAAAVEAQMRQQAPLVAELEREVTQLRSERDHVRERVERLLSQLDALEQ
jgi:uncharacterized coiled-coil protein SlyX